MEKLIWTSLAEVDFASLTEFIARQNPPAAERIGLCILEAVGSLRDFPNHGRKGQVEGTREKLVANLPYVVVYHVKKNAIYIIRVIHMARQWPEE